MHSDVHVHVLGLYIIVIVLVSTVHVTVLVIPSARYKQPTCIHLSFNYRYVYTLQDSASNLS